jgi:hypothetical protein
MCRMREVAQMIFNSPIQKIMMLIGSILFKTQFNRCSQATILMLIKGNWIKTNSTIYETLQCSYNTLLVTVNPFCIYDSQVYALVFMFSKSSAIHSISLYI